MGGGFFPRVIREPELGHDGEMGQEESFREESLIQQTHVHLSGYCASTPDAAYSEKYDEFVEADAWG